jgi:excisionase family DNA binding protein
MQDDAAKTATARNGSPFFETAEAAAYLRLSRRTLEKMRGSGGGPPYRKHGRHVCYHIADLEKWSASCGQNSTSEGAKDAPPATSADGRDKPESDG